MIIYDCEIIAAIPVDDYRDPCVEYCGGWSDFEHMGISVIGAYDYAQDMYHVYCADNFDKFQALVDSTDLVIGFNSIEFDDRLCKANGIRVNTGYDLYREVLRACGLDSFPEVYSQQHSGRGLNMCAIANGLPAKTGHGALAPVMWQQGKIGEVIDYCLHDVWLTKKLIDRVFDSKTLIDPVTEKVIYPWYGEKP